MNGIQNFEILKSDRQSDVLLLNGHLYFLNACSLNKKYWKCIYAYRNHRNGDDPSLKCGGRAKSTDGYAECSIPHNHSPDPDAVELMRRYGTVNFKGTSETVNGSSSSAIQLPPAILNISNGENSVLDGANEDNQHGNDLSFRSSESAPSMILTQFRNRRSTDKRASSKMIPFGSKKNSNQDSNKKPKLLDNSPAKELYKVEMPSTVSDEPLEAFLRKLNEAATSAEQSSSNNIVTNAESEALADKFFNSGPPLPIVKMTRTETFSSAHRLHNPNFDLAMNRRIYGKCNNANGHGHNYTWTVILEGSVDPNTGMVYNLDLLKQEMASVLELVDHKHLDKDVAYFKDNRIVSTTENLAVFLYNELAMRMESPGLLKKVVVNETGKNAFSYTGKQSFC